MTSKAPGQTGWLTIVEGKFHAQYPFHALESPDLITDDPEEVRAFFARHAVSNIFCSSSVDFPEEYGMSEEKVEQLLGAR